MENEDLEHHRNSNRKLPENLTVTIFGDWRARFVSYKDEETNEDIKTEQHPNHNNPNKPFRDFTVTVFGNRVTTTVTRRAKVVRQWISRIRNMNRYKTDKSIVVGLGVQWRPPSSNKVATLQLCVGSRCLIFQICRSNSIPWSLREFLSNGVATFVGVRNYNDADMLFRDYKLRVKNVLELGKLAGNRGASMEYLASSVLGFDGVMKLEEVGRSDWGHKELTQEQVEYACVDAYVSFQIGKKLQAWKYVC
ncbi:hypothetical protein IFM89_021986 [Coptis chinensis]|uniref:3'-5' exonuclease domain-containing protein n=1 Tax=Coptis chinensis TaxID=261450 RepID=A0A835M4E0_9MAGN|nr:hypothetical protein IFM89_021986 [Coptis chinensis]